MDPITALLLIVVSAVISYSMIPKVQPPAPAAFEDFNFPQSDEGTPQCVIFGDCWSEDWMVLAVGNYRTTEIRKDNGKK
jgi:hypothetical protein